MSSQQKKGKSSKQLVKDLFQGKDMARPLFIPLVYRYASVVSKIPLAELLSDATNLSRGLIMAQELFEYDGIMTNYDNYLDIKTLTESLGWVEEGFLDDLIARGRISRVSDSVITSKAEIGERSIVFEAAGQTCEVVKNDVPVIGVVNSPLTLAGVLLGDSFGSIWEHREKLKGPLGEVHKLVIDSVKRYCENRVDAIWLIEEDWSGMMKEDVELIKPLYETIWNVASYYDVKTVLGFHHYDIDDIEKYFKLGSDAVFFGGTMSNKISIDAVVEQAEKCGICLGLACPYPKRREEEIMLENLVGTARSIGKQIFLSTPFEVAIDVPPEWIKNIVDIVRG